MYSRTKTRVKYDWTKPMVKMTLPIVIQNLLSAAVNSADVVMLNFVSQEAISAVSLATQYANILFMVFYGISTGATALCAQYYGKKENRALAVVEGIALRFSIIISSIFSLAAVFIPKLMMKVFTNDTVLISLGASYLRILSIAYLCWSLIEVYMAVLKSIGRVTICTVLNAMAFILNIIFNAVFIFGLFGAPKLGVVGVAIGTSLSRVIELIGCIMVSNKSDDVKLNLTYIFIKNKILVKDFISISLPAMLNDVVWGLAFSMYSVVLGHLGSDIVAANAIVVVVRNVCTSLCFGVASGGCILLGQIIGSGKMEEAEKFSGWYIFITFVTGAIGGVFVLASIPIVMSFVSLTALGMSYLKIMLLINTYYVIGQAVNTTVIAGVFRAGGNAKYGLYCDLIDMWIYAVPLAFILAFVVKLPVLWVYFFMCTDEFVKMPFVFKHYKSMKWLKNITRDEIFDKDNSAQKAK